MKETLNRLVTSACETFVSLPLIEDCQDSDGNNSDDAPISVSPAPGRPVSSPSFHGNDLTHLVQKVSQQAHVIASRASAHRRQFRQSMTHSHSHSHGNLMELREGEEDEARKEQLKFPSDFTIDSTYCGMLEDKAAAMEALRGLVKVGQGARVARLGEELKSELESSLSEPDLRGEMAASVRPSNFLFLFV